MAMTSVLSRVPISVTRPMEMESTLGATRCFSAFKGPVSVSVTRPMDSTRGATLCVNSHKNSNLGKNNQRKMPEEQAEKEKEDDADELGEIALALKALNKGVGAYHLYQEVMKVEGYEFMLASEFKHLMGDEKVARGFLAKNVKFRKFLLNNFFKNHGN